MIVVNMSFQVGEANEFGKDEDHRYKGPNKKSGQNIDFILFVFRISIQEHKNDANLSMGVIRYNK